MLIRDWAAVLYNRYQCHYGMLFKRLLGMCYQSIQHGDFLSEKFSERGRANGVWNALA